MNNQKNAGKWIVVCLFILILVIGGFYVFTMKQVSKNSQTVEVDSSEVNSTYITISGRVTSINLSPMEYDGDGIYEVKSTTNKNYTVHFTSGESNCGIYKEGRTDAVIGSISKGSNVEVRGKNDDNILRICDEGTYIKAL